MEDLQVPIDGFYTRLFSFGNLGNGQAVRAGFSRPDPTPFSGYPITPHSISPTNK